MSLDDFRREPLLFGPSPIRPLPRLSDDLGGKVEIWAKREDCKTGIAFGGIQSNHTRQVTGVAYAGFPGLGSPERELSH